MRKLLNDELDRLSVEAFKKVDKVPFMLIHIGLVWVLLHHFEL